MSQPALASWWDRLFRRQPQPRSQRRPVRPGRQPRRTSAPAAADLQTGRRPAPDIVIQRPSSGESSGELSRPGPSGTGQQGPAGSGTGQPEPAGSGTGQQGPAGSGTGQPGPAGSGTGQQGPAGSGTGQPGSAGSGTAAAEGTGAAGHQPPPANTSTSAVSDGFEKANRVILRSESATGQVGEGSPDGGPSPARSDDTAAADGDRSSETELGPCRDAIQGVNNFSYHAKEMTKISELTAEAQKLLELWRDALNKKDVLAQVTRECTAAANQAGERLDRDVRHLEQLYSELAEALANLQRTTSRHKAVKKDIHAMKKVVSTASAKEQAEVSKVAVAHEKEVYSKWQSLKGTPTDVEALEKLRKELTEKQRAISGLDGLVQRRLAQAQRTGGGGSPPTSGATPPHDSSADSGKVVSPRQPVPSSRRAGAGRVIAKRRLTDGARHDRRVSCVGGIGGGQRGAAAVATQAGLLTTGQTEPAVTGPPPPLPPPLPPPPAAPGAARLLRPAAEDEDSGAADEASTSNDEDGATPDADDAQLLATAFPLHFGPALFDSLDPAEAAQAMVDAMNFH